MTSQSSSYRQKKSAIFSDSRFLFALIINAPYVRAEAYELLNEIIVAAVDVVNVADLSFTLRHESR